MQLAVDRYIHPQDSRMVLASYINWYRHGAQVGFKVSVCCKLIKFCIIIIIEKFHDDLKLYTNIIYGVPGNKLITFVFNFALSAQYSNFYNNLHTSILMRIEPYLIIE